MMAAVAPVVHSLNSPETVATLVLSLSLSLLIHSLTAAAHRSRLASNPPLFYSHVATKVLF